MLASNRNRALFHCIRMAVQTSYRLILAISSSIWCCAAIPWPFSPWLSPCSAVETAKDRRELTDGRRKACGLIDETEVVCACEFIMAPGAPSLLAMWAASRQPRCNCKLRVWRGGWDARLTLSCRGLGGGPGIWGQAAQAWETGVFHPSTLLGQGQSRPLTRRPPASMNFIQLENVSQTVKNNLYSHPPQHTRSKAPPGLSQATQLRQILQTRSSTPTKKKR